MIYCSMEEFLLFDKYKISKAAPNMQQEVSVNRQFGARSGSPNYQGELTINSLY